MLFFAVMSDHVYSQDYNFRNFNYRMMVWLNHMFIQLSRMIRGYLWVGTGNGLSRYNGFIFENFTTNDSLADNFITCRYQ